MARFGFAKGSLYCAVATATLALAAPTIAFAQDDTAESSSGLDEIVVTATKREESLQDVAVAVRVAPLGQFKVQHRLHERA